MVRSMGPISEVDMVIEKMSPHSHTDMHPTIFRPRQRVCDSRGKRKCVRFICIYNTGFNVIILQLQKCNEYFFLLFTTITAKTYSMDCYFRQSWVDRRLAFTGAQDTLALSISMLAKIWKPDTYFYNGKQSYLHTITTPNKFVRLYQDGRVLYSSRWVSIGVVLWKKWSRNRYMSEY